MSAIVLIQTDQWEAAERHGVVTSHGTCKHNSIKWIATVAYRRYRV